MPQEQLINQLLLRFIQTQLEQAAAELLMYVTGEEIARPRRSTPTPSPAPETPRSVIQYWYWSLTETMRYVWFNHGGAKL